MRFAKTKAVALSAVVTLLCLAALVVGTVAIFSDSATSNVHLAAGRLSVGLYRTEMGGSELLPNGNVQDMETDTEVVDLTVDDSSIFVITNFVPGMWREATLRIDNRGDVAFNYDVSITNVLMNGLEGTSTAASEALSKQITVTIYSIDGETRTEVKSFHLNEYATAGQDIRTGTLNASESDTATSSAYFALRVTFDAEGSDSNLAQGGDVSFDLRVNAEQDTVTGTGN